MLNSRPNIKQSFNGDVQIVVIAADDDDDEDDAPSDVIVPETRSYYNFRSFF